MPKVFSDFVSGDELLSDAFPIKDLNDAIYEVEAEPTTLVNTFGLQEKPMHKIEFQKYWRTYNEAVKKHLSSSNPSRSDAYAKGAQEFVFGTVTQKYNDIRFFTGRSKNSSGTLVFLLSPPGGKPVFYFLKDALTAVDK